MMNFKKLSALLLAGLLTVGTLAACSDKDGGDGTDTDTETETAATTEAVTAAPRYDYLDAEVLPNVTIEKSDYTGLTLTVSNSLKVTDDDVDLYIRGLCFDKREAVNGTTEVKDKALSIGDDAYIYYKGFIDGKEFDGGSNWDSEEPYELGIGSGSFIDGFEDALVGVVPNETSKNAPYEVKITFPEDYGKEELNGKEATFHVVVTHSVQYTVPEYNWEFVEEVLLYELKEEFYASDTARLKEFEEYVRDTLIEQNAEYIENAKIDALWKHLTEVASCENLPQLELDFYYNSYISEIEYYFESYTSYAGDEFAELYPKLDDFAPAYLGISAGSDWKAEVKAQAERLVMKDMIGHAIGELEGIESVTDEEYQEQIDYWVDNYYGYMTEAEVVQSMGETFLRESAYSDKIGEWLLAQVTFTYEDGTPLDGASSDNTAETEADTSVDTSEDTSGDTSADTSADTEA